MSNLNGGAEAIDGFNYQKAVACYICILNHNKKDFSIFVENNDDLEVLLDGHQTFIQVKKSILGLSKILRQEKGSKSIFFKNIINEADNARYKIVAKGFLPCDQKEFIETENNVIFDKSFEYSIEQKDRIVKAMESEGILSPESSIKVNSSYIYLFPFSSQDAYSFIIGEMARLGVGVDNNIGRISLNEICIIVDQKSSIKRTIDGELNNKKRINYNDLQKILKTSEALNVQKSILSELEHELGSLAIIKINNELRRLPLVHKSLKRLVLEQVGTVDIYKEKKFVSIISKLFNQVSNLGSEFAIYAVLIDIVTDVIIEELYNENK